MRKFSALLVVSALALATSAEAAQSTKRAVALSKQAIKNYRKGNFDEAGALFLSAYELSNRPAQLRNSAKAYEEAARHDKALELWDRYRSLDGLSLEEQSEADAHIALIKERVDKQEMRKVARDAQAAARAAQEDAQSARRAAEAAANSKLEASPGRRVKKDYTMPVVLGGSGAALLITGAVLYFVSSSKLSTVDERLAMRDSSGRITGITPSELDDEISAINAQRVGGGILLTLGAAAATTAVVWVVLDQGTQEPAVTPVMGVGSGAASLGLRGRF